MNNRALTVAVALTMLTFGFPSALSGIGDTTEQLTTDLLSDEPQEYIVGFYELPQDRDQYQGEPVIFHDDRLSYFVVETEDKHQFEIRVQTDDRVRYLEENHNDYELSYTPNDDRYADQYGVQQSNAPSAWDTTLGSTAVNLGLLDSGITAGHEDFDGTHVDGWNYVSGSDDISDHNGCSYHGSHTAGTAAGLTDNGVGIAGMSNSAIIMHKIFDSGFFGCGAASTSDIAQALADMGDNGAHISSNSWGGGGDQALVDAIDYASNKGVIHVAAAGNDGSCTDCVSEPWKSASENVIIVSGSSEGDGWYSYSSEGPEISVIAPGESVLSVDGGTTTGYQTLSGTSMATPHVAGAVGLYIDANGVEDHATMEQLVRDSARDIGFSEDRQGDGHLDAGALVGDGGGDTNDPPTASFTSDCTDLSCSFDASGSSDADGTISSYDWDFGDGNTATGETTSHTYAADGTYTVTLTVTDDAGATDTTSQDVTVGGSNDAPTASFTNDCTDLSCSFDASGSSDADGTIASYDWDFGDGNTATGETTSHTYAADGTYTVTLTVTDDEGATDTTTEDVTVSSGDDGGDTMHVHAIDFGGHNRHADFSVTIFDDTENAVEGASVSVEVCNQDTGECNTATGTSSSAGTVDFRWKHAGGSTYDLCVTDLTHDTLTWDTSADHAENGNCETGVA